MQRRRLEWSVLILVAAAAPGACDGGTRPPIEGQPAGRTTPSIESQRSQQQGATTPLASARTLPPLTVVPHGAAEVLTAQATDSRAVRAIIATKGHPRPYRRPLRYYRLAQALGLPVVPTTTLLRPNLALLRSRLILPAAASGDLERPRVANDGTVAVLLIDLPAGKLVVAAEDQTVARAASFAAERQRLGAREHTLARDYTAVAVLDYLSANVTRRYLTVDSSGGRIHAVDNDTTFPGYVSAEALDLVLNRLRQIVRFPSNLRDRLTALDRRTARRLLEAGRQEDRLLGPRQLTDLMERRATILTLLEARLLQYGPEVALSL